MGFGPQRRPDFLITAAVVYFLMILPMNKWKARQDAKKPVDNAPAAPTEVELLTEIRDALIAQRNGSANGSPSGGAGSVVPQKTQQ